MKTKIGLPFGLALVMFIGIFTTMLALGILTPSRAQAFDDGFTVTASNLVAGGTGEWTFNLVTGGALSDGDTVTLTFPTGFTVSGARNAADWFVNDEAVTSATGTDLEVILTLPADFEVAAGGDLTIEFDAQNGGTITNPSAAKGLKFSAVSTADATPVMSEAIEIHATTISADFEVELSDDGIGAMSEWTITLPINGPFDNNDTIELTFPAEFTVSAGDHTGKVSIARNWMMNGEAASENDPTSVPDLTTDPVVGLVVTLTPHQRKFDDLEAGDELVIEFTAGGIGNPTTTASDLKLSAVFDVDGSAGASAEASVMSKAFAIEVPNSPAEVVVTNSPTSPGAAAEYTIKFVTSARLEAGTAQIILDIDSSFGVPTSLSPSAVRIRADDIDGATVTADDGTITKTARPNQNRPLALAPVYRVIPGTDGRKEYKIRIPNMDGVPENPVADIAAGATVTLTLLANSGFTNPTEANVVVFEEDDEDTRKSGGDDFKVSTSSQDEGESSYISTPLVLFSDDKADNRNKPLTISGKGFKNGTTAIVYLEEMVNGEVKETDLISVLVGSDDTFEATFTVTVPPFKAGKGNMIKAKDGETPANTTDEAVEFEVEGLMTASPKMAAIGDKIQISLVDWPDYTTDNPQSEATVKIAGLEQTEIIGSMAVANGKATFQIEIGNGVPSGTQELQVDAAGESDSTNVVISGADLTVTPSTVVPNQNVTVVGQGFGDRAKINVGGTTDSPDTSNVEFGGDPAHLGVDSDNFNNGEGITTDSGGNWNASIVIPITGASTTEGTHTLDVMDSSGRSGSAEVVIAERKVTLDPPTARPGVMVQLTGSGFPASNRRSEQTAPPVSIEYGDDLVGTVNPDSSGNIATSFRVPFDASIPSSNTVTVKFTYTQNNANFDVIEHYTHEVPGAAISLSASEGKPGDTITVTGEGFAQHASISSMSIGTIDILPSPKPSTGSEGTFTTSVLIPGIDLGTHSIEVEISDTVASAVFRVVEETTTMMPEVMMAEAATPEVAFAAVIAEDNLIAVYHFDPATQNEAPNYGYTVYDARPLFMSGNNLDSIEPGQFYTVQVSEDQMGVTLGSQTVDLYAPFTPIRW